MSDKLIAVTKATTKNKCQDKSVGYSQDKVYAYLINSSDVHTNLEYSPFYEI